MSLDVLGLALPLFVAVPLLAGGLLVIAGERPGLHRRALLWLLGLSSLSGAGLILLSLDGTVVAGGVGGWPDGIAIAFAADTFTGLMLTLTAGLSWVGALFAYGSRVTNSVYFAPLLLVLTAGVNGALLTADLFNLFVFIEVMLLPSYGLFVLSANRREPLRRVDGARLYVTLNLFTSTILVVGVGFIYGITGSVNLAVLAGAAARDERVAVAGFMVLFALSIKASVVPLHGWLSKAYPSTSPAVTAIFSALHTKVGVYAIYRIYSVLYDGEPRYLWAILVLCSLTLVIGAVASLGEQSTRAILSWQMVSGIGGILVGVGLSTQLGLAAGIFYMIHHMVVMTSLFTATGAVEVRYGSGRLADLQGLARREPLIAAAYFAGLLSLVGIPPFSGFAGKLMLVVAGVEAGRTVVVAVVLVASLLSLWGLLRIWNGWFWGEPEMPRHHRERLETAALPIVEARADGPAASAGAPDGPAAVHTPTGVLPVVFSRDEDLTRSRIPFSLALPAVLTATLSLALGLGAQGLWLVSDTAAQGLTDTHAYVEAVIGR